MKCPNCQSKVKVTNTRQIGSTIIRNRKCTSCKTCWKTYEELPKEVISKFEKTEE